MKLLHLSTVTIILLIAKVKAVSRQEVNCGRRLIHHRGLIANGFGVTEGDWPWHAAISHIGKRFAIQYKCGGKLLNSNSVLTAAHCVHENEQLILAQRMLVNLGQISLTNTGPYTQHFEVYNIIPHPNYGSDYSNDIAIIRLATEAKFNNFVQPICLWESTKLDISEVERRLGTVVGWGITENGTISYNLRQAFMPVQTHLTCLLSNRDFFGSFLSDKNFCAGFRNGTTVCQGDSGGSMVFEENGVYRIRGIVSLVSEDHRLDIFCNSMDYVIFTDVAKYLTWIEEVVPQLPSPPLAETCLLISVEVDTRDVGSSSNLFPAPVGGGTSLNLLPEPLACGRVWYNNGMGGRTRINEFPWMVLIIYSYLNNVPTFGCTGVLISDRYVVTLVRCSSKTIYRNAEFYGNISGVRLGEWDTSSDKDCYRGDCSDPPIDIPVEEIIEHPNFNGAHIALIRLSRSVTFTDSFSSFKLKAKVRELDLEKCKSIYYRLSWPIDPGQFCTASTNDLDLCRDEGSPLVTIDRSNPTKPYYYCAGISLSGGCENDERPTIYVRVSAFIDWILENIRV